MAVLFERVEDWFGRLEALSSFCKPDPVPVAPVALAASVPGQPAAAAAAAYGQHAHGHAAVGVTEFVDMLAPETTAEHEALGVRISQWVDQGRFMVKVENVGAHRVHLTDGLITMPQRHVTAICRDSVGAGRRGRRGHRDGHNGSRARGPSGGRARGGHRHGQHSDTDSDSGSNEGRSESDRHDNSSDDEGDNDDLDGKKWLDLVHIDRVLTPFPQRQANIRARIAQAQQRLAAFPTFQSTLRGVSDSAIVTAAGYAVPLADAAAVRREEESWRAQRELDLAQVATGAAEMETPAFICFAFAPSGASVNTAAAELEAREQRRRRAAAKAAAKQTAGAEVGAKYNGSGKRIKAATATDGAGAAEPAAGKGAAVPTGSLLRGPGASSNGNSADVDFGDGDGEFEGDDENRGIVQLAGRRTHGGNAKGLGNSNLAGAGVGVSGGLVKPKLDNTATATGVLSQESPRKRSIRDTSDSGAGDSDDDGDGSLSRSSGRSSGSSTAMSDSDEAAVAAANNNNNSSRSRSRVAREPRPIMSSSFKVRVIV